MSDRFYTGRVASNILPLSRAQTLPDAFREWHVTGEVIEFDHADEMCQLCEQEGLRYHYGIANGLTKRGLYVGSKCILRFDIPIYSESRRLVRPTQAGLNRLLREHRTQSCLKALRRAAASEQNEILTNAIDYFERHGSLSPKLAFVVLWKLQQHMIWHDARWFKVSTRRYVHRCNLVEMPADRVTDFLWPALSKKQRELAARFGHKAPRVMVGEGVRFTYERWREAGWTDEQLIAKGYMRKN